MGDRVESVGQSGGVTAHTLTINQGASPAAEVRKPWYKRAWAIIVGIGVLVSVAAGIFKIEDHFKEGAKQMSDEPKGGDVVISHNQSGGITAHTVNVGTPPRHITDQNREAILASARANIPKGAVVQITAKWGDSEAITYALEMYVLLQSDGYVMRDKVAQGYLVEPKPPVSVTKSDDGSYYILFIDSNR